MEISELKLVKGRLVCFLNVRSIMSNINVIRPDIENSGFLAIGLSETWLHKNLHDGLIQLPGYNIVRYDRKLSKRGGGLLWFINETLDYELVDPSLKYNKPKYDANIYYQWGDAGHSTEIQIPWAVDR